MNDYLSEELLAPDLARKTYRWLAAFIDYTFYLLIFICVLMYFGEKYTTEQGTIGYHATGLPVFSCMAAWWVLFPIFEGVTGQTLGKAIFNIKVVRYDGTDAPLTNCIARHLFDFVDYIPGFGIVGIIVASNNKLKQRVGDLVGKTIVINVKRRTYNALLK